MGGIYFGDDMKLLGIGEIGTLEFSNEEVPEYITDMHIPLSDKAELSFECEVNPVLFSQMVGGVDLSSARDLTGFTISGEMPTQVQARYHKKKRINKKWIKRYGYKTVFKKVLLTDVTFYPNGTFEGKLESVIEGITKE